MLRRILLSAIIISGLALGQKQIVNKTQCKVNEFLYIAQPDGENLSYKECGLLAKDVVSRPGRPPWTVSVNYGDCEAILISRRCALVVKNEYDLCDDKTPQDELDMVAHLGSCISKPASCSPNDGFKIKVIQVHRLSNYAVDSILMLVMNPVPQFSALARPICLFNNDNLRDFAEPFATSIRRQANMKIVERQLCLPEELPFDKCARYSYLLCGYTDQKVQEDDLLLKVINERYYLRGIRVPSVQKTFLKYQTYHDVMIFLEKIVELAPDIHMLPRSPPTQHAITFDGIEKLSFPNCGLEQEMENSDRSRRSSSLFEDEEEEIGQVAVPLVFHGAPRGKRKHPWHAAISFEMGNGTVNNCGGSLISHRAVVTAAHCVFHDGELISPRYMLVTMGKFNLKKSFEASRQTLQPNKILLSPIYNNTAGDFRGDLAVLVFAQDFNFTKDVQPVCLWNDDDDIKKIANKTGEFVGWGLTEHLTQPDELQQVVLPIKSHFQCFLQNRPFFSKYLRPGLSFCAGYSNGTGLCNGDSGGGLMIKLGARWFLRGIASTSKGKVQLLPGKEVPQYICDTNYYSIFSDVAYYVNWIAQNLPHEISFK
ncbi:serine protease gd-like isoform X2 [Neocloeon triangulifer]|uniref:serine protease gd-like isoform X2 n=1 Tax=Neocloeon triangulifer TaxID=2078957 RepID=UPI00286F09F1|nr:serine protease gd-like isoform X2 [Neocloeon triangulifer]